MGKSAPGCRGSAVFGGSMEGAPIAKEGKEREKNNKLTPPTSNCHGFICISKTRCYVGSVRAES